MLNETVIQGRLTRDPELRQTANGLAVANFCIAHTPDYNKENTIFLDCTAWRGIAENLARHGAKGRMVLIKGQIAINQWTDKNTGEAKKKMVLNAESVYFVDGRSPASGYNNYESDEGPEYAAFNAYNLP